MQEPPAKAGVSHKSSLKAAKARGREMRAWGGQGVSSSKEMLVLP